MRVYSLKRLACVTWGNPTQPHILPAHSWNLVKPTVLTPAGWSFLTCNNVTWPYHHSLALHTIPPIEISAKSPKVGKLHPRSPPPSTSATMVKPSAQTPTDRSPLTSISIGIPYHHSLAERTLHLYPKHPFLAPATAISTENTGGSSIIGGISPFQAPTIYLDTFLQYFPGPWVPAPGSYLYRSKGPK